jgi:hypothetical protein
VKRLAACLLLVGYLSLGQYDILRERLTQEAALWKMGTQISLHGADGTALLEPAGIIPWLNPQLHVVDEVGLVDPWMARRRALGKGWRTDAALRYRPKWIVMRVREYVDPAHWAYGAAGPYYGPRDALLKGYLVVYCPGLHFKGPQVMSYSYRASNLLVLQRIGS